PDGRFGAPETEPAPSGVGRVEGELMRIPVSLSRATPRSDRVGGPRRGTSSSPSGDPGKPERAEKFLRPTSAWPSVEARPGAEESTMTQSYRTLRVDRSDQGVLSVVIDAPPMNLIGPELVRDLVALLSQVESDEEIRVVVLESADP